MAEEIELEEGQVIDMHGDIQEEDDCVTLHNGDVCHMDDTVYCESDGEYYEADNHELAWCEHNECYYNQDDCIWAELSNGGEGWIHSEHDYAYSEWSDRYFECSNTAEDAGFYWSENREDWIPQGEGGEDEESWDCTTVTKDTIFTKTFGMPYTFE